jgi:RNA polymerase sigma factor (sigma-70 family)
LIKKELEVALNKAVEKLDPKLKTLVNAIFIEELSYKEISEKFNIPIGSIGPTRLKIIKKLREFLNKSN